MSNAKDILAVVKKQHFWVLGLLIVVLGPASCVMATKGLADRFEKRKKTLDGQFDAMRNIVAKPDHPNEDYKKAVEERHTKLGDDVFGAWQILYEEQRKNNKLPKVVTDLRRDFQAAFDERWGPFDKMQAAKPMNDSCLEVYGEKIKEHSRELGNQIDWRYEPEKSPKGLFPLDASGQGTAAAPTEAGPGTGGKETTFAGVVEWVDYGKAYARFKAWRGAPKTLDVMLAQEDLWVYEALLRVIRQTNNMAEPKKPGMEKLGTEKPGTEKPGTEKPGTEKPGTEKPGTEKAVPAKADPGKAVPKEKTATEEYEAPTSRKEACIKTILKLEIGQDAAKSWQESDRRVARIPEGQAEKPAAPGPAPSGPPPGGAGGHPAPADKGSDAKASAWAGRYVDDQGRPVPDPTQQPYFEFRMMPVNLRLVIEQKALPKLLAECVNSNMPIDVRAVRVLTRELPPLELVETDSGSSAKEPSGSAATAGGAAGQGTGHGAGSAAAEAQTQDEDASNPKCPPITVEVQGIIYIYTPPDRSRLGSGYEGGQAPGAEAGGSPAAPAASGTGTPAAAPGAPSPPAPGTKPSAESPAGPVNQPTPAVPAATSKPAPPAAAGAAKGGQP